MTDLKDQVVTQISLGKAHAVALTKEGHILTLHDLSHLMGKPTICIGENKDADQLRGDAAKLISAFVFATRIVQFLFYLNPKFQASSSFLCLYRPVCVGPGRKPHCWFFHEAAHLSFQVM